MKNAILLICSFLLLSVETFSQKKLNVDFDALDRYYVQMVKDWDVPSAVIGIVKDGELVFTGNYGVLEVGKNEKPNAHTLYAIASNSKAFTSALIGMLVQEGKLDWNDKVKKYLPYFAMYDSWVSDHMTIRDILSHRSGLGTFSGDNIWYKADFSTKEIVKRIKYVPQAYEFRAGYGYSNLMYITAGELIESITGKSWAENVRERILIPLQMDRTLTSIKNLSQKGNYASPHIRRNDKNEVIPWVNWDNVASTGGLISSVEDLSKWMIFNLNNGILEGDTLLTTSTRNMVWTPHNNHLIDHTSSNDFNRHFSAYGLGWGLSDYHCRLKVGHTGGYDGMITALTLIPDENLGVIVLTNGPNSPIMAATYYAIDTFLGIETKDWSADLLKRYHKAAREDTRVADRRAKRALNTNPIISPQNFIGKYMSNMCGEIEIIEEKGQLRLTFEHYPLLSATLTHWHYDVWEIHWDFPQAWFDFGTIKINSDSDLKVTGFDFDVPNDDFFFEEIRPYKRE
ncbi:serine hydrolase [Pareuzebyella sediminis]|uniref:serine hydrolase n=1 Tax=Pareuzebyella sediminis TaxID=2607998 RepID=UPI0011EFBC1E|nr:serine hydrolase [Pareuzebyella sediminis]